MDDYASKVSESYTSAAKPKVSVLVVDRNQATQFLPRLDEFQQALSDACEKADFSPEQGALLVEQVDNGVEMALAPGPVVIANVPSYLAPLLEQLAQAEPELMNWPTLDLTDTSTLITWSVTDRHDRLHTVALNAGILTGLPMPEAASDRLAFARIIICCGDRVAFSGFWIDESDMLGLQGAGVSGLRYCDYSDDEQAAANAKASAAGSPTPWYGNPWRDDDQSVITQLPIWYYGEGSPPRNEDGDLVIEGYLPPPRPAIDFHIVELSKASAFLPEFDDHQMRLAAACLASKTNPDAAAFSIDSWDVGDNEVHGSGPLLMANIPEYLAPLLSKLANSAPYLMERATLDLNGGATLLAWSAHDDEGHLHTVAINAGILGKMINCLAADRKWYARVAFCCADEVAYCRYRISDPDVSHAQRAGVSELRYYSDDELIAAKLKVAEAGSTTPWYGKPWRGDDENVLTQLIVWCSEDEATSMYEEGPPLLEQYIRPTKPIVEVCLVDRTQASRYIPAYEVHQARLANACADTDVNANAVAFFTPGRTGNWQDPGVDAALIANIPSYLSPFIEKLADKMPVIVNKPKLATGENATVLVWSVRDEEGHLHSIAVDAYILKLLKTRMPVLDELWFIRIAFCCADRVAISGLWIDYADYREANDSGSEALAPINPDRLDSSPPGYGEPWQDDGSSTMTHLALFTASSIDDPILKY
jgi:hypothetical protein